MEKDGYVIDIDNLESDKPFPTKSMSPIDATRDLAGIIAEEYRIAYRPESEKASDSAYLTYNVSAMSIV